MNIELNNFAKDIKLNLSSLLNSSDQDGLTTKQISLIALASAYSTKNENLMENISSYAKQQGVEEAEIEAAKSAATIMAMNNVYYRFTHLVEDKSYMKMPARLRMNVMANPGVDKVDFELMSMAVSAINGCGLCLDLHNKSLAKLGVDNAAIQTTVRVGAVMFAAAQALEL